MSNAPTDDTRTYECVECGKQFESEGVPIPGTDALGYARYCDDCQSSPMDSEESWSAPQDPGHRRSSRWGRREVTTDGRERFGIGEAFTRMEAGEIVVGHIPERYPLVLCIKDFVLMERVIGSWYPCRKGAATLVTARFWTSDGGERSEEWKPAKTLSIEERVSRLENFIASTSQHAAEAKL